MQANDIRQNPLLSFNALLCCFISLSFYCLNGFMPLRHKILAHFKTIIYACVVCEEERQRGARSKYLNVFAHNKAYCQYTFNYRHYQCLEIKSVALGK